ncbi:MAG: tRNA(Ile)-lysidine synthase [Chlamydiales bacterium]|nr:tRNA(Ile)-lysidine synthase [Chlamydiales bacterium]MCH9634923.1 tRNA(Ile)-lysidine synthase [Chlamydiales bacterium]
MLNSVKKICAGRGPLLLALSGGPDSMALLHLMRELNHPFEVAHIDHGWREKSAEEAEKLQTLVNEPFHLKRLEKFSQNAEDQARRARLNFFRELCEKRGLEGVLLGHHADDQAETVLKRLFEGARLTKLSGLERERIVEGVLLLRPLLSFRKKELLAYLGEGFYFQEPPADDLRSRMRGEILPLLSEKFGKEVAPALCRIAADAQELREKKESFWLKESVADFFEQQRVSVSKPTLSAISAHLERPRGRREMKIGSGKVEIDRGTLRYNKRIDEE